MTMEDTTCLVVMVIRVLCGGTLHQGEWLCRCLFPVERKEGGGSKWQVDAFLFRLVARISSPVWCAFGFVSLAQ